MKDFFQGKLFLILASAIITGMCSFSVALFTVRGDSKNVELEQVVNSLNQQASLVPQLFAQQQQLMDRIAYLSSHQNINENAIYAFFEHMPFPAWLKIEEGGVWKMYQINNAYARQWEITQLQYEGKTDAEIWGPDLAQIFNQEDYAVLQTLESMTHWQFIPLEIENVQGEKSLWIISKFPVKLNSDIVNAVGGIAIPVDLYKIFLEGSLE